MCVCVCRPVSFFSISLCERHHYYGRVSFGLLRSYMSAPFTADDRLSSVVVYLILLVVVVSIFDSVPVQHLNLCCYLLLIENIFLYSTIVYIFFCNSTGKTKGIRTMASVQIIQSSGTRRCQRTVLPRRRGNMRHHLLRISNFKWC